MEQVSRHKIVTLNVGRLHYSTEMQYTINKETATVTSTKTIKYANPT